MKDGNKSSSLREEKSRITILRLNWQMINGSLWCKLIHLTCSSLGCFGYRNRNPYGLSLIPQQQCLGGFRKSYLSSSILVSREIKPKSQKEITHTTSWYTSAKKLRTGIIQNYINKLFQNLIVKINMRKTRVKISEYDYHWVLGISV